MKTAELAVPGIAYPVFVGTDPAVEARLAATAAGRDLLVVTDVNVAPQHLQPVCALLDSASRIERLVLAPGEASKTLDGFVRILDALAAGAFHRDALLVALGGGVIGDLAGFAAACYQRGVDWMAVPTTLLAQVDAALGGKTAVNHPAARNLIGAFHDPIAVWTEPDRLATLPAREYRAGLAEVVKYGLGLEAGFFEWLDVHAEALDRRSPDALFEAILRSSRIKLEVVAADRTERGRRMLLNLGHTVGHALEKALGYGRWLHGEAVAVGLAAAAELSVARGTLDAAAAKRLRGLLRRFGLPTSVPHEAPDEAFAGALALDKKIAAGRLRFVGLERLGVAAVWNDVAADEIRRAIAAVRNG